MENKPVKIQKGTLLSPDNKYQYALWRIWNAEKPLVFFITLNPTLKEENSDSATILKCVELGNKLGFGGVIIGHLFAFRCDDPNEFINTDDPIGPENDACIERFVKQAKTVIAAWGMRGTFMERHDAIMRKISNLHCFGITENGQPVHPLAVTEKAELKGIKVDRG